jgi:hypothetical protein
MVDASALIQGAFFALPVLVVGLLLAGLVWSARVPRGTLLVPGLDDSSSTSRPPRPLRAGIVAIVWLALSAAAALAGKLSFTTVPPTMMVAVVIGIGLALSLGLSHTGERLAATVPLAALVGSQAFRFPLELAMHRAMSEGLMPVQMSYSGLNFDILTGLSALLLGVVLAVRPVDYRIVRAWNAIGFLLLFNIVTIAVLSTPLFRVFHNEPANTWIASFPYVWLPTVLVPAALLGHVLVWRRLRLEMTGMTEPDHRPRPA